MFLGWINNFCSRLAGMLAARSAGVRHERRQVRSHELRTGAVMRPAMQQSTFSQWVGTALAVFLCCTALSPNFTHAADNGDQIINQAWLSSNEAVSGIASVTVTVRIAARTPAELDFFQYAPGNPSTENIFVAPTDFRTGANASDPFAAVAPPRSLNGGTISLNQPLPLLPTEYYHRGEPVFLRLTDQDQNLDPTVAETVLVTLVAEATGDTEVLRFTETGQDTGVFTGQIQSGNTAATNYDGVLAVAVSRGVDGHYVDIVDNTDTAQSAALFDPYGIVFDSNTGEPINGARVTLYNDSGNLATVYGDNGSSSFPSSVVTGEQVSDSSGQTYDFADGEFRFPFVAAGSYRLEVTPPDGYTAPSTVSIPDLQQLSGAPYALNDGSFGELFVLNPGPALRVDIPLDPAADSLWLRKRAHREIVSIGDFLQYTLTLDNSTGTAATSDLHIRDILPPGFRYQKGSLFIDGSAAAEPDLSDDGSTMAIFIGSVPAGHDLKLSYVVEVSSGVPLGESTNRAVASDAGGNQSNTARATVLVRDDFFQDSTFLLGRVMVGSCDLEDTEKQGLENVRIYLEDGTYVDTDENGNYHFEGIDPGVHVVQVDTLTLPKNFEMLPCEENNQFAGRKFSQFVDLQGGTLWRADFHAAPAETSSKEQAADPALENQAIVEKAESDLTVQGNAAAKEHELPIGLLSPTSGQTVNRIDTVRVRLKSDLNPHLSIDGRDVPADRIGFRMNEPETGTTIYSYIGVDFGEPGAHKLKIKGVGPFGNTRFSEEAELVRTGDIVSIRLLEEAENVADGRSPVRIRVELIDEFNRPVQTATRLGLDKGLLSPLGTKATEDYDLLEQADQGSMVAVDAQGWVSFEPVDQSGYFPIRLVSHDTELSTEIFVRPYMRDWILVGFAEGTMGYNNLSGNAVSLDEAGIDDHYYDDSRVKFFAKGAIKGEWLLTMAYDSDKPNLDGRELHQFIDPNAYYPLYGDTTLQGYEASSAREIYIRLEREQFYAMFGDMNTNLSQTELSRYTRTMNGFKSEMQTYRFSYTVFAAETRQSFAKDEIRGDGTSGRYYLTKKDVVVNSEEVVIESRDRLRNEIIINSETLSRYIDYDIDYETGSLYFKHPVPNRDDDFNPVFIVARYETYSSSGKNLNYGGRAAVRLFDQKVEVGASYIHEEEGDADGDLYGLDAIVALTPRTTVHLEAATTDKSLYEDDERGDAYVAEVVHDTGRLRTSAYFREVDAEFGLGQLNNNESNMRKYGAEAHYAITPKVTVGGLVYHEDNLSSGAERDVATVDSIYNNKTYSLRAGLRHARDELSDGTRQTSSQLLTGANWTAPGGKLGLRADYEQSLGGNDENTDFPTLLRLGADYKLSSRISLFADQEFTWGEDDNLQSTRAGLRATPWDGGAIDTTLEQQIDENGQRLFALFGLGQTWRINQNWSMSAILEHGQRVKYSGDETVNPNAAPAYGADDDFTSVSLGTTYRREKMIWTSRIETRQADREDKYGATTSIVSEVDDGTALSARANGFITDINDGARRTDGDIRFGLAYRPQQSKWIILDRLDFYFDEYDGDDNDYRDRRLVNNLHANFKPNRKVQLSLYSGIKYVRDTIDGRTYSGVTDMHAAETRYSINKRWDVGVHGSALHSWHSDNISYSAGLSVGCMVVDNTWVSVGYNVEGFTDDDFDSAHYTARGVYLDFA